MEELKFSDIIEQIIANFPKDKIKQVLTNEKIKIEVLRTGIDQYSIRTFGIEIARKKGNSKIEYQKGKLEEIKQKMNAGELGTKEIGLPDEVGTNFLDDLEEDTENNQYEQNKTNSPDQFKQISTKENEEETKETEKKTREEVKKNETVEENKRTNRQLEEMVKQQKRTEQQRKKKTQERTELNLTRENSSDEALKQFIFRTMKINAQRVVRVRTGFHTYEYEIYDQTGKNIGKNLLTPKIGGKNPRMKIWILNNEGHYEQREVDSLLLTQNGRYGFATDRGNSSLQDNTISYQVTRLPGGEYVAIQALEQQKRNREASHNIDVKELTASKKSDYEMKSKILAAESAEEIDEVQKDGKIDTQEVRIIELLRKEGFKQDEIEAIFRDIYQNTVNQGMTCQEVEKTIGLVKDLKEQGASMKQIKNILEKNNNNTGNDENDGQRTPGGEALERLENRRK